MPSSALRHQRYIGLSNPSTHTDLGHFVFFSADQIGLQPAGIRRIMGLRRNVHRFFLQNVMCMVVSPCKRCLYRVWSLYRPRKGSWKYFHHNEQDMLMEDRKGK